MTKIYISNLGKKNYILKENIRYRNIILGKLKNISNLLLISFDICFEKNKQKSLNYKYTITSHFHRISNLNYLYKILLKKLNHDICINIFKFTIKYLKKINIGNNSIKSDINFNNLNNYYYINFRYNNNNNLYNLEKTIQHSEINNEKKKNQKINIIPTRKLKDFIVRDTINLKLVENLKNLLNNKDIFDVSEIFNLEDDSIDFIEIPNH